MGAANFDRTTSRRTFRSSGGVTLVGDVGGPKDAPIVVLMHGGGQTRHSWSGCMSALIEKGYRVFSFDARGHGESDWSKAGAYELDDRVDDLLAVIDKQPGPVALVGASLGGATALRALALGMRPAAVALVDIVPHVEPEGVERIVGFMRSGADGFATLEDAVDAVAAYNPSRPRPSDPAGLMRNLRTREDGRLRWHWDPRILSDEQKHHDILLSSAHILARRSPPPLLLVRGLHSDVVSDAGVAAFRDLVPALEVADVAGAGHMVAGDRNDAFNAAVLDFLTRQMRAERQCQEQ